MSETAEQNGLKPGDELHGFVVESVRDLPEYHSTGILLSHRATGCRVYHVRNDDRENLFAFAFQTLPRNDTGVAHILEHSVLAGSERFPVKDPFLLLLKSSMNTFLNAFTFPDKTVYPASSTVEKDFYNLMLVYGDAVFFPVLRPEVFRQEGHRLAFRPDGSLERVGVVYNEMKGAYSNPDSVVGEWSYRSLFPGTIYEHDSGGEPAAIPQLTYEEFVDFHRTHYHPSNTAVFLYGDIPTGRHLHFLQDQFLSRFERREGEPVIDPPVPFDRPLYMEKSYAAAPGEETEGKSTVTVNWMLPEVTDPLALLSAEVLSEILLGHSGSPLQQALVESELGEDLSPASGIETELKWGVFSAGLRGTDPERRDEIEGLIFEVLRKLADNGIPKDAVEGALRKVEFRNREIRGGGGPYGLRLMRRTLRGWLHGGPPERTLSFRRPMDDLRKRLQAEPRYFEGLVRSLLLDNVHRSVVTVRPEPGLQQREDERVDRELASLRESMGPDDERRIREEQERLREFQERPDSSEAEGSIPYLTLADVPREIEIIPKESVEIEGIPGYYHDLFTNGIAYLDFVFDLEQLDEGYSMLLPLFGNCVTGCGLPGVPYDEVSRRLSLTTGGFGFHPEANGVVGRPDAASRHLFFRVKALVETLPEALELVRRLFTEADTGNRKRVRDLFLEERNDYRSAVIPSGNSFASLRALRALSPSHRIEEAWHGISQLLFLSSLEPERDIEKLCDALAGLREQVMHREGLLVNVTCDGSDRERVFGQVAALIRALPGRPSRRESGRERFGFLAFADPILTTESFLIPAPVGYVAAAMPASPLGSDEHVHELVLAHMLRTGFLWETIRMKGGAYGASASTAGLEGMFSFSSYRDPNIIPTLDAYRKGLEEIQKTDRETVEKAIIGSVGRELRPHSPAEQGLISLKRTMYGIGDDLRRRKRQTMIGTGPDEIAAAAKRLLAGFDRAVSVVLAGRDAVEKAGERYPDLVKNQRELPL